MRRSRRRFIERMRGAALSTLSKAQQLCKLQNVHTFKPSSYQFKTYGDDAYRKQDLEQCIACGVTRPITDRETLLQLDIMRGRRSVSNRTAVQKDTAQQDSCPSGQFYSIDSTE